MTKALAVLAVTAAVVVWLALYDTHPPKRLNAARGSRRVVAAVRVPASGVRPGTPGTRTGKGPLRLTPFTSIQVEAVLRGDRLVGVRTLQLTGSDAHTEGLNARAEPLLRAEALRAGSATIDTVTGATYTSRSWRDSLQAAIAAARQRGS